MATIKEVAEAVKQGKRISHQDWYDGQKINWYDAKQHLLISKEKLLSDKWVIHENEAPVLTKKK